MIEYVPVLITVAICIFARQIGERLGVVDLPDSERKIHSEPTPLVGGIAIMAPLAALSIIHLISEPDPDPLALAILLCAGGVAVVGFMDDQRMISPGGRLILLAIFAYVAVRLDPDLFVAKLHTDAWGWLPVSAGVSTTLVVLSLMGFSSAVNMVDGTNSLVLSLLCIWSFCLAMCGGSGTEFSELLAVASFIALLFNARGRLFLGDCGSFSLAFAVGLIAIDCHNHGTLSLETVIVWFFLPVVDCLRLIPVRILRGRSPFRPDLLHFHHRLAARIGQSAALGSYLGLVAVTSLAATLDSSLAVPCILADAVLYFGFMFADAIAPPASLFRSMNLEGPNIVALDRKRRPGA